MTARAMSATGLGLVLLAALEAGAACTTKQEARGVLQSARKRATCNDKVLRSGPGTRCPTPPAPPACAGNLVDNAIALAYGANNPPAARVDHRVLKLQLRCQKHIGRGVSRFIGHKLKHLINGKTRAQAEAKARKPLDKLPKRCAVPVAADVSGVRLPAVGPLCQQTVGNPGAPVDPDALRACLLTILEVWVDAVSPSPPAKANLVIILTDDQRWDTTGLVHSRDGVTPVMPNVQSRLVASGVDFPNAFVTNALCCPSRASILSGQFSHTNNVLTNTQPLGGALNFDDTTSLATWLDTAGYQTGLYGKYLNGYPQLWDPPEAPYVPPGWDEWHAFQGAKFYDYTLIEHGVGFDHAAVSYPSNCPAYAGCPADQAGEEPCPSPENYSTDVILAKALTFLDQAAGQPFFLYFAPYAPHGPACPAMSDEGTFSAIPPWRPPNFNEADVADKPMWVQALCPMTSGQMNNVDNFRKQQLESLQAVDRAIGAIMDKLVQIGADQTTLVLYTADNGYSWGAHCHRPKRCPYDECNRVPLTIRAPFLALAPRVEPRFGLNIDFAFTFAELAGVVPPIPQDGRSLVRLLQDLEPAWRTDFLYEQWEDTDDDDEDVDARRPPTLAQVHGPEWKYTEYATNESELYNIVTDPFELQNETNNPAHAEVRGQLAARLRQLRPDWSPSGAFLDDLVP